MVNVDIFFVIFFSYLCGSIPFAYLFTKLFLKKDIRKIGSGNIGATNALRTGNKFIGFLTLFFDVIKSILPILITKFYITDYIYISSLSVFLGHVFPIWLKFKGGKGVATYFGILCCVNIFYGFAFSTVWLISFLILKYSSLSSLLGSLSIPLVSFFIFKDEMFFFFIIMFVLIFYTHKENIKRLLNHSESKTKIY
ncbi:MAG: glycerol-3-phosphate 1-O-acyltransferase [Candidatus Pelagibacter sp. TMED118]|nr:MAG: glycerol-3-phosphate 1-O-acyltransferase [Candidatus Pelagibacter sp. TMED118]|tara:strand:+ start:818 stop:1405 length:588 start_codon:yes stop_codon:yes gene_type:complete